MIFKRRKLNNLYVIVAGIIKIIDAITPIVTIGFYWTDLEYQFAKWYIFRKQTIK